MTWILSEHYQSFLIIPEFWTISSYSQFKDHTVHKLGASYLGMQLISKNSKYKLIIGYIRMYPAYRQIFATIAMKLTKIETGQSSTLV